MSLLGADMDEILYVSMAEYLTVPAPSEGTLVVSQGGSNETLSSAGTSDTLVSETLRVDLIEVARQGPPGVSTFSAFSHVLTSNDIAAKSFSLPVAPASRVMLTVGGIMQTQDVDFVVGGTTLSWSALALELLVGVGDSLFITYSS